MIFFKSKSANKEYNEDFLRIYLIDGSCYELFNFKDGSLRQIFEDFMGKGFKDRYTYIKSDDKDTIINAYFITRAEYIKANK